MQTPEDLDRWLDQFPYEAAKERIKHHQTELTKWQQWVNLYEASRHPTLLSDSSPSSRAVRVIEMKPTLRRAVKTILGEATEDELEFNEIHSRLVKRGWLRPDPNGKTNLYSMLSTMAKQNEVRRSRPGWYQTATPELMRG